MAIFNEDGLICEVEVLEDKSDKDWKRYKLRVINVIRESPLCLPPKPGEEFSVEQVTKGAWVGMWFLTDYEKPIKGEENEN